MRTELRIKRITFCTGTGSNWVKCIEKCNHASVCFNSESEQYNIALVGIIEILTDIKTKKEMWFDGMRYYIKGPEDPNFCASIHNATIQLNVGRT